MTPCYFIGKTVHNPAIKTADAEEAKQIAEDDVKKYQADLDAANEAIDKK